MALEHQSNGLSAYAFEILASNELSREQLDGPTIPTERRLAARECDHHRLFPSIKKTTPTRRLEPENRCGKALLQEPPTCPANAGDASAGRKRDRLLRVTLG